MEAQTKKCQNCKKDFTIEPDDFGFYEKIKVPPPTFCPDCRMQRRLSWRNDYIFYNRKCDLCKRDVISVYSPDNSQVIYCNKCWWSDEWDPKSYGIDFDFSKSFFEQFADFRLKVPTLAMFNDNNIGSENCEYTQDFAYGKNCYMCLVAWKMQDCMYLCYGADTKDAVDCMGIWGTGEGLYETMYSQQCFGCRNVYYSSALIDCLFCYDCSGCEFCFLCMNLRNKKYCIKNVQYSKEEYFKLKEKIIDHMTKTGEWGEFFPMKYSPFAYNETMANLFFPMTKTEIINSGLRFQENLQQTKGKTTLKEIPENINDVSESIINEILECAECQRNYKITPNEFSFYKKWQIPIPRKCFFCRFKKRFSLRTPSALWHRRCMCNKKNHFHQGKCEVEFETSYAPDRPEIIYCEKCYQQEVY